jgi:periplasmic divalent cation tolerance protein
MMIENSQCLVFSTCPTQECAQQIAQILVEQHLAAGVNLVPHIQSVYRWQGEIKNHEEVWLIIKTRTEHFTQIQAIFQTLHPYQVPELILLPITHGLASYLAWIDASCQPTSVET